jgi:hypothetical protein
VFGVSDGLMGWGKPDARKGLRTRGSQRPLDSRAISSAIWNIGAALSRRAFTWRRLRYKNSYAGFLARSRFLLRKQTECRIGIHFARSIFEQTDCGETLITVKLSNPTNGLGCAQAMAWFLRFR